jgi:hypothetical protein
MSALSKIKNAGFDVVLVDGFIEISPADALTDAQRNYIKSHKQEIIKQLSGTQLQQDIRERIEERAAIMEYDGGLTRKEAEQAAAAAIRVYCYRVKEKPDSELVAIMPNTELDEAYENLRLKYGDRLLTVYESKHNPEKAGA